MAGSIDRIDRSRSPFVERAASVTGAKEQAPVDDNACSACQSVMQHLDAMRLDREDPRLECGLPMKRQRSRGTLDVSRFHSLQPTEIVNVQAGELLVRKIPRTRAGEAWRCTVVPSSAAKVTCNTCADGSCCYLISTSLDLAEGSVTHISFRRDHGNENEPPGSPERTRVIRLVASAQSPAVWALRLEKPMSKPRRASPLAAGSVCSV